MVLVEMMVGKLFPIKPQIEKYRAESRRDLVTTQAQKYIAAVRGGLKEQIFLGNELGITDQWTENDNPDRDLLTNSQKISLEQESQLWAHNFGVWHTDTGPAYNTMSLDAHEFAFNSPYERDCARLACDIYNLLYYFDDLLSNDRGKILSKAEKSAATSLMMKLLLKLNEKCSALGLLDGYLASVVDARSSKVEMPKMFAGILPAMDDIMKRIGKLADPVWQQKFYTLLVDHLVLANADHDGDRNLINLDWYIHARRDVSGMKVMLLLAELIAGGAIDRTTLDKQIPKKDGVSVSQMLQTLEEFVMDIGGIWNDFISSPKEILRDGTVFNIIAVYSLHLIKKKKFEDFEQALHQVTKIYGTDYLAKFDVAYRHLSQHLDEHRDSVDPVIFDHVRQYVYALRRIVVGTWNWQHGRGKPRYETNEEKKVPDHFYGEFQRKPAVQVASV